MSDYDPPASADAVTFTLRGGPLDLVGGVLWIDPQRDLTGLTVSVCQGSGGSHTYHHDGVRGPSRELLLRYVATASD